MEKLEREREEIESRATAARAATMNSLAGEFEAAVGGVVGPRRRPRPGSKRRQAR